MICETCGRQIEVRWGGPDLDRPSPQPCACKTEVNDSPDLQPIDGTFVSHEHDEGGESG